MERLRAFFVRLFRPRLITRVALGLGAVGLLPLAIVSFGLVDLNRDAITDQVLSTHSIASRTAAERTDSFLATRMSFAQGLAGNPALADPSSPAAQELLRQSLQAWTELGVLAIAIVDPQGEEAVRAQLADDEGKARAARAFAATGPQAVLSIAGEARPLLRISAALPNGAGSVRLACDGEPLLDIAQPNELGDEADILLLDPNGRIVLGSATTLANFPKLMVESALQGKSSGAGRFKDDLGEEILGAYAPVPSAAWTVVSRQPSHVAEAVSQRLRRRSMFAIGAALSLIAALSVLAWASVVSPLRELLRAQRRLARVDDKKKTGDEISDLKSVFGVLERSVTDREALAEVFLGRYQVIELIGSGAMGSVFRGWDPKLERSVALKTVRLGSLPDAATQSRQRDQLTREAITVARISHANIVAIYDVQDAPEAAFMAMELIDGTSLENLLWSRSKLSPDEVIPLGAGVARGLAAAHERHVVHRDIKPANLLLGRDGAIKITDFGIAELVSASERGAASIFGTPGYIPPETLRGAGYTETGDLFALGVVLYQCLAGRRPFGGGNVRDIVRATIQDPIPPLAARVPGVPPELAELIHRLLERDPTVRPQSAADVAADLEWQAASRRLRWRWTGDGATPIPAVPDTQETQPAGTRDSG